MLRKTILLIISLYIILANISTTIFAENETLEQSEASAETTQQIQEKEAPEGGGETSNIPEVIAESAVMIDADTGVVLYEKDCHRQLYPASITKIMTTLLTLENTTADEILTHSHNAVYNIGPGSSHIGMREDEQITIDQALHGIMLASANEVCMAVAEHIDGDVDKFVERMNKKAAELGCVDTHFNNPHGFHDDNHYTTAYDMSLIMREAVKNENFVELINTETYTIDETNIVNEKRVLNNSNKMLHQWSPYYYEYCVGAKTGFTDEAGNTLVTYGKKDDINLITVVMKDQGTNVYTDSKALLEYGFSLYEEKTILKKEDYSKVVNVTQKLKNPENIDGMENIDSSDLIKEIGIAMAVLDEEITLKLPNFISLSDIKFVDNVPPSVSAPIKKGDKIGELKLVYNNIEISRADIVSANDVDALTEESLAAEIKKDNFKEKSFLVIRLALLVIAAAAVITGIAACLLHLTRGKKNGTRNKVKDFKS